MRNSYKCIELPRDYAQKLLEREIEVKLSREPIHSNICNLLELYSIGFEYFESIGNYKHKYFEIRMKEIFTIQ